MNDKICTICKKGTGFKVADFGELPIAHSLVDAPGKDDYTHPLRIDMCPNCGIAKINDPCPPEKLYLNYNFNFSSWKSEPHRSEEILMIQKGCGKVPSSVFEIGCNDGSFMALFDPEKVKIRIGLEPNPHPAAIAEKKGVHVINQFLNSEMIDQVIEENGGFDLVVARQVMEHLHDYDLFFECLDKLIADNGHVFIDIPDSDEGFKQGDCSILWDEHVTYFSEPSLINIFYRHGYEAVDLKKFNFSGGIISCLFKKNGTISGENPPADISDFVDSARAYDQKIETYRKKLIQLLTAFKGHGFKTVLYGVGCRGAMLVNCLGIGSRIDFAVDDQTERQGRFMPGAHVPIHSSEKLADQEQNLFIILAVGQENNQKVRSRINTLLPGEKPVVISACSPSDIFGELEKAELKIDIQ